MIMRLAASCSQALAGMLKELKGDRREQTGMREKERLGLEWSRISGSDRESLESPLGQGVPPKRQWVWRITSDIGMRE